MNDSKRCPACKHPMMSGPLRLRERDELNEPTGDYRTADWFCANCHHVVWAKVDA